MILRYFISLLLLILANFAMGQTVEDLLRISQNQYINTARSVSVAGSFGSLGADISVANTNPAGIAEFRKSEIALGFNYANNKSNATIYNNATSNSENKFQLGHIGGVFTNNPMNFDVKTMNIAVGLNQIASFQDYFSYEGSGPGTIVERFLEQALGRRNDELDPFEAGPAYDVIAILDGDNPGEYDPADFVTLDEVVSRSQTVDRKGGINEFFLTVASNRKNKLSWGVTIGLPIVKFEETKIYSETDQADNVSFFNSLSYQQSLDLSGAGINLKAGIIYKIKPSLRIGLALHTPTVYAIEDNYRTDLNYNYTFEQQTNSLDASSGDPVAFPYNINTPWRALAGVSYLYKLNDDVRGFVSGDVEYVDYSSGQFSVGPDTNPADEAYLQEISDEVSSQGASTLNYRIGTELAYSHFRARLGVGIHKSPYKDTEVLKNATSYSSGVGYRGNKFYIDVAYSLRSYSRDYRPYSLSLPEFEQRVETKSDFGTFSFTIGYKI